MGLGGYDVEGKRAHLVSKTAIDSRFVTTTFLVFTQSSDRKKSDGSLRINKAPFPYELHDTSALVPGTQIIQHYPRIKEF